MIAMEPITGWRFENTYAELPEPFFADAAPAKVREPKLALFNRTLARELGLSPDLDDPSALAALFAGQQIPDGARPIAQAYAGHQFGGFTMLGDGRAILLGEQRTPSGQLRDIQFKGSGPTAFSRRGDGRAALGPMLREYLISEAMHALGIPTTRCLAVVTTGEPIYRQGIKRGAVLTRVAASHIRVGTFQYIAARRDSDNLKRLADYTLARHDPDLVNADSEKYIAFYRDIMERQAKLIAQWQLVGFIHGVMNTDNMSLAGETIDYGPCAFMNRYNLNTVYSSIDEHGRYAYGNQPNIAQWNLARLAEAMLSLFDADPDAAIAKATEVLNDFAERFRHHYFAGLRSKLGLLHEEETDRDLVQELLDWMATTGADFTNTFADLSTDAVRTEPTYAEESFQRWYRKWQLRLARNGVSLAEAYQSMESHNPWVIPRNHQVEAALTEAEEADDFTRFNRLLTALQSPYQRDPNRVDLRQPPVNELGYRTFCGT